MSSLFRTFLLALLALAFAAFGLAQASAAHGGAEAPGRFTDSLPALAAAILSFGSLAAAILVAIVLLVRGALRLARRGEDCPECHPREPEGRYRRRGEYDKPPRVGGSR